MTIEHDSDAQLGTTAQDPAASPENDDLDLAEMAVIPPVQPGDSWRTSITRAEQAGLLFAFRARCVAILLVACAIAVLVPWPRTLYYLSFAAVFFVFGYIPFLLRQHRHAEKIRLAFVVFDVLLITSAVLNLPSSGVLVDWPMQTRLRNQNFLLLLLLLGEAALTYSSRRVLWTGGVIAVVWSAAFFYLYTLPDTVRYADIMAQSSDAGLLSTFLSATYVSLPQWLTQLVATLILTVLLATAVHRSRGHLLGHVWAEMTRSDLARYLSPDVADALSRPSSAGFGQPATRQVAVLFADIVGFTSMSERLTPQQTFALLRSFQERSAEIVFRHRGTLDKFLGDGLMATFGALHDEDDAAARAIACAFELRDEIDRWSNKRQGRGARRLTLAVGVHYGSVMVGNLGAERRVEFTAVGDVVNVASRLEQATRELGCAIAVSDECLVAAARGSVPPFDNVVDMPVRGRQAALRVHTAGTAKEAKPQG